MSEDSREGKQKEYGFYAGVQEDILRLIATDPAMGMAASNWVKPEYFTEWSFKWVAEFLTGFYRKHSMCATYAQVRNEIGMNLQMKAISESKAGTLLVLVDKLYQGTSTGARTYTIELIQKFAQQRAWEAAILEAIPYVKEGRTDALAEIMGKAQSSMVDIDSGGYWFFESATERARRRKDDEEVSVLPTGILELDMCFRRGGLRPPEVGMWMAPRGRGKSIALSHVTKRAVIQRWPTALYSFEMSSDQVSDRLDSSLTGIDMWALKEETDSLIAEMEKLSSRYERMLMIRQFPTKGRSIADVRRHLDSLRQLYVWRPKLIVIDYIGIVKPPRLIGEKHLEMQETLEAFRELCDDFNCVGWTAAQINREGAKAEIADGTHASSSWDQLATADVILTLNQRPDEKRDKLIRIFVDKCRDGKDQITVGPLHTDWERMQFVRRTNQTIGEVVEDRKKRDERDRKTEKMLGKGGKK